MNPTSMPSAHDRPVPSAGLGTRFLPPRLGEALLPRPELERQLLAAEGRVALLLAPPGSGKTLLMARHHAVMAGAGRRTHWLTLTPDDNDPDVLRRSLAQAFCPDHDTAALPDVPPGIAGFIDGLEQLAQPAARELAERFLLSVPADSCMLASSSSPHSRLLHDGRLCGLVHVLGPHALRMDDTEACALLGPTYSLAQVERLNQFTGGWAAGLRFLARAPDACLRLLGQPDHSQALPPPEMTDYFEHILERMPAEALSVLMELSALERFTPELLAALPAPPCDWARVEQYMRNNLFLHHADDSRNWAAFHPAFGHHLRQCLRRLRPERYTEIRHFAASWFEAHGHTAEAVRHAVTLRETPLAARIIENTGAIAVDLADGPDVTLEYLPVSQAGELPLLFMAQIYHRIRNGRQREAQAIFEQAMTATRGFTRVHTGADCPVVLSWAHMLEVVFLAINDLPVSSTHIARMEADVRTHRDKEPVLATGLCTVLAAVYLDLSRHAEAASLCSIGLHAQGADSTSRVNIFVRIHQAHAALAGGSLEQAALYMEDGLRLARTDSSSDSYEMMSSQLVRGVLHFEANELDDARRLLQPNLAKLRITNGWVRLYADAFAASAAITHAREGLEAALAEIDAGEAFARERELPRLLVMLTIARLRELTRAGEWKTAKALLDSSPLSNLLAMESLSPYTLYQQAPALLEAAQLMLELGRPRDAVQLLERINKAWLEDADHRLRFDFRVLALRAAQGLRRYNAAFEHMQAAIDIARRSGLVRRALDARQHLIIVFDGAVRQGRSLPLRLQEWIEGTLRHADGTENVDTLHYNSLSQPRHDGTQQVAGNFMLSPRESEIMALIAEGCINKEIATRLGISEGTVKGHRKNVYEKLGVSSRSQAITRARELLII